jgi:hypothetical protein
MNLKYMHKALALYYTIVFDFPYEVWCLLQLATAFLCIFSCHINKLPHELRESSPLNSYYEAQDLIENIFYGPHFMLLSANFPCLFSRTLFGDFL